MITPFAIGVVEWADQTSHSLAEYGIIPRLDAPGEWRRWADEISALPGIAAQSPPDPRAFDTWQAWAFRFNETVQPGG